MVRGSLRARGLTVGRAGASPPASESARHVSQGIALTTVALGYDRPVARGREIYGGIVEWDVVSTPGANRVTAARVRVGAERGDHMETLAFYFPVVGEYEAVLRLHWASTILPFRIEVPR